jgi:hypothetical protein
MECGGAHGVQTPWGTLRKKIAGLHDAVTEFAKTRIEKVNFP